MRTTDADQESSQSIQGVKRALDVLDLFGASDAPSLGVTEIAQKLQLSKAVIHRILSAFKAKGFVEMDPVSHRYMLGPQIVMLGLSYLDRVDTRGVAHAAMVKLAEETNETATFSVRAGFERVYIDQVTPDRDVKMVVQLGKPFPLHTGASSKALLASLSPDEQETYLTSHELLALTDASITDPDKLRKELVVIRELGYATSFGERDEGAGSVAAPVFGYSTGLVGVISVSGPIERFRSEIEDVAQILLAAVRSLSQRLGYRPTT
jgi:IclR family transcriptional regulator, acetate operon repressor